MWYYRHKNLLCLKIPKKKSKYRKPPLIRPPFILRKSGLIRRVVLIVELRAGEFVKRFIAIYLSNIQRVVGIGDLKDKHVVSEGFFVKFLLLLLYLYYSIL